MTCDRLPSAASLGSAITLTLALTLTLGGCGGSDAGDTAGSGGGEPTGAAKTGERTKPTFSDDAAVAQIQEYIWTNNIDAVKKNASWRRNLVKPPQATFAAKKYFWNLTTNHGDVKIELLPEVAPMHVSSTIYLTELGYYDGLKFHRVIPTFMAQGGCPFTAEDGGGRPGTGGPGYQFDGEFADDVKHDRPGLLSMANGGPGTDGSQFFLTFRATPHLDGKHTIFGRVVEGMGVLRKLEERGSPSGATTEDLLMEKATITVE